MILRTVVANTYNNDVEFFLFVAQNPQNFQREQPQF